MADGRRGTAKPGVGRERGHEMQCAEFEQIDVELFLLDEESDGLAAFRAHYPDCADCAGAVADWMSFDLGLREALAGDELSTLHPPPDELAVLARSRQSLDDAVRGQLEAHVESCDACRTEFALLSRYDALALPSALASVRTSGAQEAESGVWAEIVARATALRERLGTPGVAAAAVAVAAVALFWMVSGPAADRPGGRGAGTGSELAAGAVDVARERDETESAAPQTSPPPLALARATDSLSRPDREARPAEPAVVPSAPAEAGRGRALAAGPPAARQAVEPASPMSPPVRSLPDAPARAEPLRLAERSAPAAAPAVIRGVAKTTSEAKPTPETPSRPAERPGAIDDSGAEVILLAALVEMPVPEYASPFAAGDPGWSRPSMAVRSATPDARVQVLAPRDHAGLTLDSQPRLWWRLDAATSHAMRFTLLDEEAIDPLTRLDLPGPHEAGLHSIDLDEIGVLIEDGVEYRWFISLLVDEARPSRNPVSSGSLKRLASGDARRRLVDEAKPEERGHVMAQAGIWYDAYDFFASLAASHPEVPSLSVHRDRLAEVVVSDR